VAVHFEPFAINYTSAPGVDDYVAISDPDMLAELIKKSGLASIDGNADAHRRIAVARREFMALPDSEYQLYAAYLTRSVQHDKCTVTPPDEALLLLAGINQSELFDQIIIMSHPVTGESLMVGAIDPGSGYVWFKLAQWGDKKLTTADDLREVERKKRRFRNQPEHYGVVTLVLIAVAITAGFMTGSWWIYAAGHVASLGISGLYVMARTPEYHDGRDLVGAMAVISVPILFFSGIITWAIMMS
jgi:hypothetical protein